MKLTKAAIDKLVFEGKGTTPDIRYDEGPIPGFGIRIYESGKKSFVVRYTFAGKRQLKSLGKYGVITLDQARDLARQFVNSIASGVDPSAPKPDEDLPTFGAFAKVYLERHSSRKKSGWQDKMRIEKKLEPAFGKVPLKDLNRVAAGLLHERLGKESVYEANRVLALISNMWNKAQEWGYLPDGTPNPAKYVKKFREESRDRFVTEDEMPRLLKAIDEEENPYARAAIRLYLFTGLRKNELLSLEWANIDLRLKQIKLPDTKAGRPHYLPLTEAAIEELKALPRVVGNPYVFVGEGPRSHLVDLKSHWRRIRKAAKVPDVRIHDLRRTVGSWLALDGVSLPMIGKVLNHSNTKTTEVYARFQQDSVRSALERLSAKILAHRGS